MVNPPGQPSSEFNWGEVLPESARTELVTLYLHRSSGTINNSLLTTEKTYDFERDYLKARENAHLGPTMFSHDAKAKFLKPLPFCQVFKSAVAGSVPFYTTFRYVGGEDRIEYGLVKGTEAMQLYNDSPIVDRKRPAFYAMDQTPFYFASDMPLGDVHYAQPVFYGHNVKKPQTKTAIEDWGYADMPRGWYDAQGLGKKFDYGRWCGEHANPQWKVALAGHDSQYSTPGLYSQPSHPSEELADQPDAIPPTQFGQDYHTTQNSMDQNDPLFYGLMPMMACVPEEYSYLPNIQPLWRMRALKGSDRYLYTTNPDYDYVNDGAKPEEFSGERIVLAGVFRHYKSNAGMKPVYLLRLGETGSHDNEMHYRLVVGNDTTTLGYGFHVKQVDEFNQELFFKYAFSSSNYAAAAANDDYAAYTLYNPHTEHRTFLTPAFYVYDKDADLDDKYTVIYEHALQDSGTTKYQYDERKEKHHSWGPGTPVFKALRAQTTKKDLNVHNPPKPGAPPTKEVVEYGKAWVQSNTDFLRKVRELMLAKDYDASKAQDLLSAPQKKEHSASAGAAATAEAATILSRAVDDHKGRNPPEKYTSFGFSIDASFIMGVSIEHGMVRDSKSGKQVKRYVAGAHEFGTSVGVGVGWNWTWWYCGTDSIEGLAVGFTPFLIDIVVLGLQVVLWYDNEWKGLADYPHHPLGVSVAIDAGVELKESWGIPTLWFRAYTELYPPHAPIPFWLKPEDNSKLDLHGSRSTHH